MTVVLREGDDLVVAELRAGSLVRRSRLPGCQIRELRGYPVRVVPHDRGISVIAPAADGGTPVHVADSVGGEFTTLPPSPCRPRSDRHPAGYHVLRDGTTLLVGADRKPAALGAWDVPTVHRLPWRAAAWEEVPVPDHYDVTAATSTPADPLVLVGGRLRAPRRLGDPYRVPVLLTPAPAGGGWEELDFAGQGRPRAGRLAPLARAVVDPRRGSFASATGSGELWCATLEFGDWWEHFLLYAADLAGRSWSYTRVPLDRLAGRPSVTADGVTAVTTRGRLLRYTRGTRRWTTRDLGPVLRGIRPGAAGFTVTGTAVAGNRLLLAVGLDTGEQHRADVICSLPPDGASAEVLFATEDPGHRVRALTL
ncbi:hypothetical protein [Kitasatospora sp. NPDC047058]|uniref:hypothetical protein n=1 Tax=Kitasatospora sp. NPDC047058 TaxID=3155620 RepID=UPI0033D75551